MDHWSACMGSPLTGKPYKASRSTACSQYTSFCYNHLVSGREKKRNNEVFPRQASGPKNTTLTIHCTPTPSQHIFPQLGELRARIAGLWLSSVTSTTGSYYLSEAICLFTSCSLKMERDSYGCWVNLGLLRTGVWTLTAAFTHIPELQTITSSSVCCRQKCKDLFASC